MKLKRFFQLVTVIGLLSISCSKRESLTLATYTYHTNDRIDNLTPLGKLLEQELGIPVEVVSYADVSSFVQGIKSNEVDIALINTLGYLQLTDGSYPMHPVANLKINENASDNYKSVLLARKELATLESLHDSISDLSLMLVSKGSTSGNLVPRLFFSSLNIKNPEKTFNEVSYGGNHTSTLDKLLAGETDVSVVGSSEYFSRLKSDSSIQNRINRLWMSAEIPLGPVLIKNDLDNGLRTEIIDILMALAEENESVLESIKSGWSEAKNAEGFQKITDEYYDSFRTINGNTTDLDKILMNF